MGEQTFGEAGGGDRDYPRRCGTTLWRTLLNKVNTNTNKQTNTGKQTQNMQKGKAQLQVTEMVEDTMAQRHQAPKKWKHKEANTSS